MLVVRTCVSTLASLSSSRSPSSSSRAAGRPVPRTSAGHPPPATSGSPATTKAARPIRTASSSPSAGTPARRAMTPLRKQRRARRLFLPHRRDQRERERAVPERPRRGPSDGPDDGGDDAVSFLVPARLVPCLPEGNLPRSGLSAAERSHRGGVGTIGTSASHPAPCARKRFAATSTSNVTSSSNS